MIPRVLPSDTIIGNYKIPQYTLVMSLNDALGRSDEVFPNASEFIPERWLKSNEAKPHPFANFPFGIGPRMCIGKRFAELEMQALFFELLRNFRIEWKSNEEPKSVFKTISVPASPLKFKFIDLQFDKCSIKS